MLERLPDLVTASRCYHTDLPALEAPDPQHLLIILLNIHSSASRHTPVGKSGSLSTLVQAKPRLGAMYGGSIVGTCTYGSVVVEVELREFICHMRPSVQEPDPTALEQGSIGDFGSAAVPITRGYAAKAFSKRPRMLRDLDTATGNPLDISLLDQNPIRPGPRKAASLFPLFEKQWSSRPKLHGWPDQYTEHADKETKAQAMNCNFGGIQGAAFRGERVIHRAHKRREDGAFTPDISALIAPSIERPSQTPKANHRPSFHQLLFMIALVCLTSVLNTSYLLSVCYPYGFPVATDISYLSMLFHSLHDSNMPLFLSLRGLLVLLTASSVAFSLPQVPTIESVRASLPHPPTAPGPQSPQEKIQGGSKHAHLLARRAEIHELEKRQQVNCTNPEALFFTQCWIILNIQDYLIAPGTGWINTVRTCQDTGGNTWDNDGSTCCVKDEPWSTCYTRLNVKGANIDCTSASTGRCSESMLSNIKVTDPELFPYVRYTLKNIYAINNFFVTYYDALYKSAGLVGNNIEQMIQVVDKIVKPAFNVQNLLLGLAVGLAFLGAPSFALRYLSIEAKWLSGAAQGFVISAQQAPNVGRALWPEGTENSQLIQTADLHLQMSNLTNQMSIMMDGGVHLLMTEITTFVNYAGAGEGRYSGPNVTNTGEATGLTVPTATDALGYALKTYVLSYAMGMNRWYAGYDVGPYNSEAEVEAAFSCKFDQENYVCVYQNEYVTTGKVYFWSPTSLRVYTMDRTGPDEALEPYEMIKTINAYKWAPLDILFDGAFNCTSGGLAGSSAVTFNYDGRLDLACVSQLPMYTECGEMCPVALIGGECPFADVSKIKEGACKDYDAWL